MFLQFLILFLLLLISLIFIKSKFTKQNLPPGPWQNQIPFFGFLPFLNPKSPHKNLHELSKKFGKIFGLQMGSIYTVVLADVALIRETLRREEFTGRAPLEVTFGIFDGYGLICAQGDFWKDQRSLMIKWLRDMGMIKFGPKREQMQTRIMDGIHDCVEEFRKNESKILNPVQILTDTFGNIVIDFIFGFKYEWNSEEWKYLKHLQEEGIKLIGVNAAANFLPILKFLPSNRKNMDFLLSGKENQHKVYELLTEKCQNNFTDYPDCILKRFLLEKIERDERNDDLAKNCSQTQLNHLLADTFGAALDTTLGTLRWFLLLIAIHRECQTRIFEEMKNIGLREKFELEDVNQLNYLKASVAETLRLKTVVPCGIPHGNPTKETTIAGFNIPKGTMIMPLLYAVHMDESAWPEPTHFNPTRFIDENEKFFTPPNFIPFQVGKRMCLGEELAKMFLHLFTANIIANFEVKLADKLEDINLDGIPGLTLSPPDYRLVFKLRENYNEN